MALFGDCIFDEKVSFRHVTFERHCHFREAIFNNGLDLDYTNIEKEMNFFGIKGIDNKQSKKIHLSKDR